MRFVVACVGKSRHKGFSHASNDYLTRLNRWCRTDLVCVKESHGGGDEARAAESAALLKATAAGRFTTIALHERGDKLRSLDIAAFIERGMNQGESSFAFLIGGADGHDPSLLDQCDHIWSLSDATLPHELALVVLLEQLYRAGTIIRGEPYHRE
jgi:23S rRNA (pseudouridine1915-N3)-methyltransferase